MTHVIQFDTLPLKYAEGFFFFFYAVEYPMWSVFPLYFCASGGNICRSGTNSSCSASDRRISRVSSESHDMAKCGMVKMSTESSVKVASFDPQEDKNMAVLEREPLKSLW